MQRLDCPKKALHTQAVIIAKGSKPLVKLVPVRRTVRRRRPGSTKSQVIMSKDFGAPLEGMEQYS